MASAPNKPNDEPDPSPRAADGPAGSQPDLDPTRTLPSGAQSPQSRTIGGFHIKRQIATGGMGVIYEALQEKPRRVVALKVMRSGVVSPQSLRRFELESQTLARLRHPAIAQIYEAGTHDDGTGPVPYFAMEYIPNAKPLTEYSHSKGQDVRERLGLFIQVCDAVHHGHQKGIIHRDLKPGNILVDSHGQVKVIDFGVARSTDSDLAMATMQTSAGQLVGTLQYMSPEQCEAVPEDLDIRSDVYSLGVVLYELLAGRLPYDVSRLPIYEATRVVREEPATRISAVQPIVRGDLETIVQKALEKDRDHRYQSAFDLGQDVARYLRGEPISAHPPSVVYQLQLFARRHRAFFVAGAAAFVALLLGVIVSTVLYVRAESARTLAAEERDRAREAEARAEAINDFLVHDLLYAATPEVAQGRKLTVEEVLAEAARRVDTAFPEEPELAASLRSTLGDVFWRLGLYPLAMAQLDSARSLFTALRGESDAKTLEVSGSVASLYYDLGMKAQAESLYRATLSSSRSALGSRHPITLGMMSDFAAGLASDGKTAEAESLAREALAGRSLVLGPDDQKTLESVANLAAVVSKAGKYAEAESLYRVALESDERVLGKRHPDRLTTLHNFAAMLADQSRLSQAEPIFREVLAIEESVNGKDHPYLAVSKANLANLLTKMGKHEEAISELSEVAEIYRKALGPGNALLTDALRRLAEAYIYAGQPAAADSILREVYAEAVRARGDEDPDALTCYVDIGWALWERGRPEAAEPYYADTFRRRRRSLGETHPYTLRVKGQLATLWSEMGRHAAAESLALDALRQAREALPENSSQTSRIRRGLGAILIRAGRAGEAEVPIREALEVERQRAGGEDAIEVAETESLLAECLTRLHRYEEAEELLSRAYPEIRKVRGAGYSTVRKTEKRVRDLYEALGHPEKATRILAQASGE
jgi:tetratricopeptide (TPR) repeat protein